MIQVTALHCYVCNAIIWSRYRHDFHYCPCGHHAIDGGFDYVKLTYVAPEICDLFDLTVSDKEFQIGTRMPPDEVWIHD